MKDLGQNVKLRMRMDAPAALGIAQRRGVCKVGHLDTGTLWLQEKQLKDILKIVKLQRGNNVADICTKNVRQALMEKHLTKMNNEYRGGRVQAAVQPHSLKQARRELHNIKEDIRRLSSSPRGGVELLDRISG